MQNETNGIAYCSPFRKVHWLILTLWIQGLPIEIDRRAVIIFVVVLPGFSDIKAIITELSSINEESNVNGNKHK